MDGLFCNTWLRSTCGSKVHRVPFISPLFILLGQQRLVSQLLSLINRDWLPDPAWMLSFHHLWHHRGTLRVMAVFGSAPVSYCQAGLRSLSAAGGCHLSDVFVFFKKSPFYVCEVKSSFPELMPLHLHPTITWFCSLESKETALVSNLTGVIFLVCNIYCIKELIGFYKQHKQTCNSSSTFVIYKSLLPVCVWLWQYVAQSLTEALIAAIHADLCVSQAQHPASSVSYQRRIYRHLWSYCK